MKVQKSEKGTSLRTELTAVICILTLLICMGLGGVLYSISSSILNERINDSLISLARQGGITIDKELQKYKAVVDTIANIDTLKNNGSPISTKMGVLNAEATRNGCLRMTLLDKSGKGTTTDKKTPDLSEREYFKLALAGQTNISDPVVSVNDNKVVVVVAAPIKTGDNITGVLTATYDVKLLSDIASAVEFTSDGYAFMLDKNGVKIAHENYDLVINQDNDFENVKEKPGLQELVDLESKMIAGGSGVGKYTYVDDGGKAVKKIIGYAPVPGTSWSIGVTAPEKTVFAKLDGLRDSALVITVIFLLIGFAVSLTIAIWIARPVSALTDMVGKMAALDLTAEETASVKKASKQKNEIGRIARSILHLRGEFHGIINGVRTESNEVMNTVGAVMDNIGQLNSGIQDVSATTEQLSAGMEETAASSQEMNATSQEIETAVESIATRAQEGSFTASAISQRATGLSKSFGESQKNARDILSKTKVKLNKALEESKSVEQINTLSDAIMQITSQTNLLALNAAIEAARAGESGKGFAVVAEEIRKLAEDSKNAVTQIQQVIKTVISSVENLSSSSNELLTFVSRDVESDYNEMLHATEQYNEDAGSVNSMTMDFSATSEELLASIQNMLKAINEITQATNEGAEGTTNIAARSSEIVEKSSEVVNQVNRSHQSAQKLIDLVSKFKV